MVMNWDDKADVRLFIHVLKIHNVKLDYAALAQAMGPEVTAKAITHRIAKLRSIAASAESSGPATPVTPSPRRGRGAGHGAGTPNKGATSPTNKRGRKRAAQQMVAPEAPPEDDDAVPDESDAGETGRGAGLKGEADAEEEDASTDEHDRKRVKVEEQYDIEIEEE